MIADVDAVVINDEEARLLTKEYNLVRCAKKNVTDGGKIRHNQKSRTWFALFL